MIHDELIKALKEKVGLPLSVLWKAALWLEKRYREDALPGIPFLIAQHYEIMGTHSEASDDPHLVELLKAHADYWANLGKERELEG